MTLVDTLRRRLAHPPTDLEGRQAAVAAILLPDQHLLFMRRAERAGDPWSGHVSFPGGRRDPGDRDSLATAVRETWEELGLDLADAELLGALEDVSTPPHQTPLTVRPWVFRLDALPPLNPNHEVASVHTLGLEHLRAGTGRSSFEYPYRGTNWTLPCVDFDGLRLWGMTLRMVDDLVSRLEP